MEMTKAIWVDFDPSLGFRQRLPTEGKRVLVVVDDPDYPNQQPAVAVGYVTRDPAGPTFISPGVTGNLVSWCDCLGSNFEVPAWRRNSPANS
jgi:hypothetical protein